MTTAPPDTVTMPQLLCDVAEFIAEHNLSADCVTTYNDGGALVHALLPSEIENAERLAAALAPWSAALGAPILAYPIADNKITLTVDGAIGAADVKVFGHAPRRLDGPVVVPPIEAFQEIADRYTVASAVTP